MTLVWELLIAASVTSLISAMENISIKCTVQWILQGAPGKKFPSGCTPAASNTSSTTTPTPNTTGSVVVTTPFGG